MINLDGKLSVVMPAYNEEKLIYSSIKTTISVISGFVKDFEIVAVNDGSTDATKEEIKRAMKEDGRVRMVSSDKNRGKGTAIISSVTESEGKYIAFLDEDLELNSSQPERYFR